LAANKCCREVEELLVAFLRDHGQGDLADLIDPSDEVSDEW
jgi:hypothetical protein